jgi:diguanylate cyclase (GGDEF)-like protein
LDDGSAEGAAATARAALVAKLAHLGRAPSFSPERFDRELARPKDGPPRDELLRLLFAEWTGIDLPLEDVPGAWASTLRVAADLARSLGSPVSLQTALLHEFHTRRGLLKEPRILSDREISALRVNAITDPLTGLYNRRFLLDHLDREISRAERTGGVVSVLMMDLKGFKVINDRLGHPMGDTILVRTARAIRESLRAIDAGCRYGGDEFVVVLPNSDVVDSISIAERIRRRVEKIRIPPGLGIRVGLNYGVSSYPTDGRVLGFLLKMSDVRLYASKRQTNRAAGKSRRYPRFAMPGLKLRVAAGRARRNRSADVGDIGYGGISFITSGGTPPPRLEGEIVQPFSSETHNVSMRRVSAIPLADGRVRVGCVYEN